MQKLGFIDVNKRSKEVNINDRISSAFSMIPSNKFFSFTLESCSSQYTCLAMPDNDKYVQVEGCIHGGVITALADTAAAYILYAQLEESQSLTSIEFKMNFLRPARAGAGILKAEAKIVKRGKRVSVCEVDVYQGEKAIAKGLFTYMASNTKYLLYD